jgi:hypothetical protein
MPRQPDVLADDFGHFAGDTEVPERQLFFREYWRSNGSEPRPGQSRGAAVAKAGGKVAFNVMTPINGGSIGMQVIVSGPAGDGPSIPSLETQQIGVTQTGIPKADGFYWDGSKIAG